MQRFLFLCLLALQAYLGASDVEVLHNPQLIEYAKTQLPHYGYLRKEKNGFVYLHVSPDFIKRLLPLITQSTVREPPYFGKRGVGAHVSVIHPFEIKDPQALRIAE